MFWKVSCYALLRTRATCASKTPTCGWVLWLVLEVHNDSRYINALYTVVSLFYIFGIICSIISLNAETNCFICSIYSVGKENITTNSIPDECYTEDDLVRWIGTSPLFITAYGSVFKRAFPVCEMVGETI